MLSTSETRQFKEQGYLVLEAAINQSEVDLLRQAALNIVENFDISSHRSVFSTKDRDRGRDDYFFDSAENIHCFLEEGAIGESGHLLKPAALAINKIGHALHDLNPVFRAFCKLPLFGRILRELGYICPLLWQTMYIFKQPRIGGEVRWHQDGSYLISNPPSVTGIWIAIEDADRNNGCLWVQPQGQRSPLREIYQVDWAKREGSLNVLDSTPWPQVHEAVAVEVPVGSVVIFHDHMPHYSSQNFSDKSRHAFTMHVAEKSADWSSSNWLQRPTLGDFEL
jgi:phytanoyl-CoA hydroxylase